MSETTGLRFDKLMRCDTTKQLKNLNAGLDQIKEKYTIQRDLQF